MNILTPRREKHILAVLTVAFLCWPLLQLQAGTIVQGPVSGNWTPWGSPYQVVGDVTVAAGDSLWIDSGVVVEFSQNCNLKVYGTLVAVGLDSTPVVFKGAQAQAGYWGSLYFDSASPPSLLMNVEIRDALTGVVAVACSLDVINTTFTNNITGMDCKTGATPNIEGSTFTGNTNSGLRIQDASPWVKQCTFTENSLGDLQPTLTVSGVGVPHITRCVFRDNGDVAIQVDQADSAVIANNSIVNNLTGIVVSTSSCVVSSNIVVNNDVGVGVYTPVNVSVDYNDVWNNATANYDGDLLGLGNNVTVNVRGDSCDLWQNISENPRFLWPDSTDLTLSAESPCIDTGNPLNPGSVDYWGDGPDMGAFEHDPDDERVPVELVSLYWSDGKLLWTTASETDNLGFLVQFSENGSTWETLGFVPGNGTTARTHQYTYPAPRPGHYRLVQVDHDGSRHLSQSVFAQTSQMPKSLQLSAFPNPANPNVFISLIVPEARVGQEATVSVYDVRGRKVAQLYAGKLSPGNHRLQWNGRDEGGTQLASGVYTVVLRQGKTRVCRKITLLR